MIKIKKLIAFVMCIAIVLVNVRLDVFADSDNEQQDDGYSVGQFGGYLASNKWSVKNIKFESKYNTRVGHGFAAERANNLIDIFHGKNATIVGDDNLKNGADRLLINRDGTKIWIQDKYYQNATDSVNACFGEDGMFRYLDADGNPMQIEVPADQYDDAVIKMANKIQQGKIEGVSDPEQAKSIVKKGNVTYKQAKSIAKAGNISSLKYDAQNGIITASSAVGISFAIDYAVCMINGNDALESLEIASMNSLKTGGVVFCTYVISSQLSKTGLSAALMPTSEAIAKSLGDDVAKSILKTSGINTAGMTSSARTAAVAKIINNQAIFGTVTVVVLSADDVVEAFQGRISREQLLSNLAVAISSTAGGIGGMYLGGAAGTAICPGVGTVVGSIAGGIILSVGSGAAADYIAGLLYEGDAEKMYDIIVDEFQNVGEDYLVTEGEVENIVEALSKELSEETLKDMFESDDREKFARKLIEPLFDKEISKREIVEIPSEEEIRAELKENLKGVALVH